MQANWPLSRRDPKPQVQPRHEADDCTAGGNRKRVVADRFRPASLRHFWTLGLPLEAADQPRWPHRAVVALARVLDGGFGFALIRIARPGWSISNAPVSRTRSLSFR